jgi:hypothetical protein
LKIDRHLKDLTNRLNVVVSSTKGNNDDDDSSRPIIKDDEYYLSIGSEPPRFLYYGHVRAKEWEALGHKAWDGSNDEDHDQRITQDELDFRLKRDLREPPEERYQREKKNWLFHDCSSYMRDLSSFDESCCSSLRCVPECRYYPKYGRIEDAEVIEEHNKTVKELTEENAIVEPPDMNSEEAHDFLERYGRK